MICLSRLTWKLSVIIQPGIREVSCYLRNCASMSCHQTLELKTLPQESSQLEVVNHSGMSQDSQSQSSGEASVQFSDVNGRSTSDAARMSQKTERPPPPPLRPLVKVLACFAAIGGFLFGYDTGVVSGAMILLKKEFGLNTIWQELIVSVTIGAAALSALCGGFFNEKLGRRRVILIASTVFTAGALMMGVTPNKEILLAGRIVVGIGVGLASMTVPMYIAEVAPVHIRGRLVTINNLFITGGQFIAAVVDGAFSYWPWGWRAMLGLAGVPSAIQLIGFIFLPESPRWLIDHGQLEKAKNILKRISGPEHWQDQYQQIVEDAENTKRDSAQGSAILRIFRTPPVLRALIVGCSLQMFQQLAGINTIMYYSATIIRMSGVKDDSTVIWLSAVVAFANFFFTLAGVYLVEKVGRRVLTLSSFTGVAASVLFLALAFLLIAKSSPSVDVPSTDKCSIYNTCDACILSDDCGFCYQTINDTIFNGTCLIADIIHGNQSISGLCDRSHLMKHDSEWAYDYCPSMYAFMSFIGLILYLIFFAPGMGPMPWTINSEIYPQWARSTGNAIASTVNWSFNLLIAMTFLSLTELITQQGAFFLYFGICVLGIVFIFLFLPETKGTRLEDIQQLFEKPVCCGSSETQKHHVNHADDSSEPLLNHAE